MYGTNPEDAGTGTIHACLLGQYIKQVQTVSRSHSKVLHTQSHLMPSLKILSKDIENVYLLVLDFLGRH